MMSIKPIIEKKSLKRIFRKLIQASWMMFGRFCNSLSLSKRINLIRSKCMSIKKSNLIGKSLVTKSKKQLVAPWKRETVMEMMMTIKIT